MREQQVGVRDLESKLRDYLRDVEAGTTIVVMDQGRHVADRARGRLGLGPRSARVRCRSARRRSRLRRHDRRVGDRCRPRHLRQSPARSRCPRRAHDVASVVSAPCSPAAPGLALLPGRRPPNPRRRAGCPLKPLKRAARRFDRSISLEAIVPIDQKRLKGLTPDDIRETARSILRTATSRERL